MAGQEAAPRRDVGEVGDLERSREGRELSGAGERKSRTGAADAVRALVEAILFEPDGDQLKITLTGDLAGMLSCRQTAFARECE